MKTASIFLYVFILINTFSSCKKNVTDDGLTYYQFTDDDKSKLLTSMFKGSVLKYKNQDNNEINFHIVESENGKTIYSTGTFSGGTMTHFYYDRQSVVMQYTTEGYTWSNCEINLMRYPVGPNYQAQYPFGIPIFKGYMTFPLWNGFNNGDIYDKTILIDFTLPITTMTINSKTYNKVRIFNSNKTQILEPNNLLPAIPKNVNIIYYDQNFGIIGFDDLNGKKWRLQ